MKKYIQRLIAKDNLSRLESYNLFNLMKNAPVDQQAAVLALLRAKNETVEELLGARDFFFAQTIQIKSPYDVVDIVGTGGDGFGTFNISTAASLVVASCGLYVAKHGGKSATSKAGSADVIEALGIYTTDVSEGLSRNNYAYLRGSLFNAALKQYAPLRKSLSFPTIFNILGPLMNPTSPKKQVIGVYRKDLVIKVAQILESLGSEHALVVHSEDGLDELSVSAPNHIAELKNGNISQYIINPADVGLAVSSLSEVLGGSVLENAQIIKDILLGKIIGPKLDIVLLNSAAGLLVAGAALSFQEAIEIAREAISSGKTAALLNQLQNEESL
jgi:anthranilate phosphoribosyltransferase